MPRIWHLTTHELYYCCSGEFIMLGYYCDMESHHAGAIMHAIAVVGAAALAVGERQHSSGRDILAAIVIGIDAACRVSYAPNAPALHARGFHLTCVAGTFGSLAAAARLLDCKDGALRNAFGLAGTEASGLLAWVSDPTEHARPFNMGLASRHGVFAAHLASCGFGGPPTIFEGKYPLGLRLSPDSGMNKSCSMTQWKIQGDGALL